MTASSPKIVPVPETASEAVSEPGSDAVSDAGTRAETGTPTKPVSGPATARVVKPGNIPPRKAGKAGGKAGGKTGGKPGPKTAGGGGKNPRATAGKPAAKTQAKTRAKTRAKAQPKAHAPIDPPVHTPAAVPMARTRGRHWMAVFSFLLMVVLPVSLTAWYLWERAVDQYASYVGFSVRTEEVGSAVELLGGITELSGSSSSDTDILYEFLQGQELVAAINADMDLRAIWARANPEIDPIFAYHPPGTIEDLVDYWGRMVKIYYDSGTGLLDLRVLAFDPEDATRIATQIYARSSAMINELSAIAREDAISYAREELTQAEDRLREARVAIQAFRNRTQIIDPTLRTQTQSGLIGALETQLAEAQIELQLLLATARSTDPRITQTELKIDVIQRQIAAESSVLGLKEGGQGGTSVADLVGEYEVLAVDLEFAQQAYTAARATFDAARNEARRQSRYLAAHVNPTAAERAQYPDRVAILGLISLFLLMFWAVTVLVAYALRDRR